MKILAIKQPEYPYSEFMAGKIAEARGANNLVLMTQDLAKPSLLIWKFEPDMVWVFGEERWAQGEALMDAAALKFIPSTHYIDTERMVQYGW
jgi:hypothetical protein